MQDNSPPMSIDSIMDSPKNSHHDIPRKYAGQTNGLRSIEEIRILFIFNLFLYTAAQT